MLVLAVNAARDSLKCRLLDMPGEVQLAATTARGLAGNGRAFIDYRLPEQDIAGPLPVKGHAAAFEHAARALADPDLGAVASLGEIGALGHRLEAGALPFGGPFLLAGPPPAEILAIAGQRPGQMEPALAVLGQAVGLLPGASHLLHFDDAFFLGLPPAARAYALPREFSQALAPWCGGAHGLAHQANWLAAGLELDTAPGKLKVISLHLGERGSLAAICQGRPLAVTALFSPEEGLPSAFAPGSLPPGVWLFLADQLGIPLREVIERAGRQGGWQALAAGGADWRALEEARRQGEREACLAFDFMAEQVRRALGGMFFSLGGADAVVISGGVGENSPDLRAAIFGGLGNLGLVLEEYANRGMAHGKAGRISHKDSPCLILAAPGGEELSLARAAWAEVNGD